jgi:hypothetical protein
MLLYNNLNLKWGSMDDGHRMDIIKVKVMYWYMRLNGHYMPGRISFYG